MNNSYRSLAPGTPLDLRTRSRDTEMSRGSRSPRADCDRSATGGDRGVRAETSGSAGRSPPRRSGLEQHRAHALSISTAPLDTGLGPALSTPRTPTNSESRTSLSTDSSHVQRTFERRAPGQIPSRLPLRKRPFPTDAETLTQSSVLSDTRDRFLTENTDTTPSPRSPAEYLNAIESTARRTSEPAPARTYRRAEPPAVPFPDVYYPAHTYFGRGLCC